MKQKQSKCLLWFGCSLSPMLVCWMTVPQVLRDRMGFARDVAWDVVLRSQRMCPWKGLKNPS